ncbi:MAG: DUF1273 family protein [Sulfurovum sp.]|nr:DUF1273 family protein [Sulfurovaceae bacterium]
MLKIGITGHRELNKVYLSLYEKKIFTKLKYLLKKHNKVLVISPLAYGADRLIVKQALKLNIEFIAVLPMPIKEYEKDFDDVSKVEFYHLLSKAKKMIVLPNIYNDKNLLYEQVGHYISDNSDILFALWDGKNTGLKGGTSEIVKYHKMHNKVIYHIKVDRHSI